MISNTIIYKEHYMRLSKHINEATEPLPINIINELMKVNTDYLKDVKGLLEQRHHYLQRGTKDSVEYAVKNVRQDRKPTDSNQDWHDTLNAEFQKKFHVNARSQALFCSRIAGGYAGNDGSTYIIFPIGDYYMLYSPTYPDLFLEQPDKEDMPLKAERVVRTIKKSSDWNSVYNGAKPINEVMVICKSYLMIKVKYTAAVDEWIKNEVD
jgi:hypothetical protein